MFCEDKTQRAHKVLTCAKIFRYAYMTHRQNLIKLGYVCPTMEISRISCGSLLAASSAGNKNDYGKAINNWDNGGWVD